MATKAQVLSKALCETFLEKGPCSKDPVLTVRGDSHAQHLPHRWSVASCPLPWEAERTLPFLELCWPCARQNHQCGTAVTQLLRWPPRDPSASAVSKASSRSR